MDKLRARFEKTGKAVYISHLDLMRVIQRAFTRADVALKYSEGYNPHPLISVCLPLSVGCASVCELMDFRIARDEELSALPEKLNAVLPAGIRFTQVYEQSRRIAELKWLRVRGVFDYDSRPPEEAAELLRDFFSRGEISVTRRTKRGEGALDLAQNCTLVSAEPAQGGALSEFVISAQEPTVNPELLAAAMRQLIPDGAPDFASFTRIETYDAEMKVFR